MPIAESLLCEVTPAPPSVHRGSRWGNNRLCEERSVIWWVPEIMGSLIVRREKGVVEVDAIDGTVLCEEMTGRAWE